MARKPTDTVNLRLRFNEKLRRRIESAAKYNDQSMNAEIVDRLKMSFAKDDMEKTVMEAIGRLVKRRDPLLNELLGSPSMRCEIERLQAEVVKWQAEAGKRALAPEISHPAPAMK